MLTNEWADEMKEYADELFAESELYFRWASAYANRCRERSVPMDLDVYDDMHRAWRLMRGYCWVWKARAAFLEAGADMEFVANVLPNTELPVLT